MRAAIGARFRTARGRALCVSRSPAPTLGKARRLRPRRSVNENP